MRPGKILLVALLCGLFLLLLSALVVVPEGEAAVPPPADWASMRLLPMAMPSGGGDDFLPLRLMLLWLAATGAALPILSLPPLPSVSRDANGRVLQAPRYVDSFYPLFHPEAAAG